ncbi:hypothetical protein CLM62_01590, partial [Streptomyces sp. SA15]|uniref:glycosyltransferase 87 family protein n=1 Tax=Streptomyces sp. SA15 TaxID=934019 RepID=UPI000BC9A091
MSERKSDISGWLVRRASRHLWVVLGGVLGATAARAARLTSDGGMDNGVVMWAARTWPAGGSPYDDPHFLHLAALCLAGLAADFAAFAHLALLADWTATAALAPLLALLPASRGRWVAAGAVVGAAVALKPLLAPLALLFLFARRWRAPAALVLVPVAASAASGLLMPDPAGFFTRTLPFPLYGDEGFVR